MSALSRRTLLRSGGLLAAAAALGACDTSPAGPGTDANGKLVWWDQFKPLSDLQKALFAEFTKAEKLPVEYTVYNPEKQGQALQLAKQSNQLPDVFSLAGVQLPAPTLVDQGWFAPITLSDAARKRLPDGSLLEGVTVFDGKPHSYPLFSFRQYTSLTWFNKNLLTKAGLDPDNPPANYDDFRAAARLVKSNGGRNVSGWVAPLKFAVRLGDLVTDLAQAGGAAGGVDFRTGAYAFHSQPFLNAFEFLLALHKDKLTFPASSSLDARSARARWAAGVAGFFFDGPWNIGVVTDDLAAFTDKVGVGSVLVPERGATPAVHVQPHGGTFWLSRNSKHGDAASMLLSMMLEPDYQRKLAENMDQPPIDLDAADKADVHPAYRKALGLFRKEVFLGPSAVVKNPAVAAVQAEMKDIQPDLGQIVQGAFSGSVKDVRAALKQLSDKSEAERERAIGVVTKAGAAVSVDDWRFPDWKPRADYGSDAYGK